MNRVRAPLAAPVAVALVVAAVTSAGGGVLIPLDP